MHPQHRLAAGQIRRGDRDLAIESARAEQRRIENVGPVRRCDEDYALSLTEPVHLDEQLVEGLLTFVMAAAESGAALAAHGVDLVDEDDRRRVLLGLFKHVAHAGGADTHEHLHEVRPGDREEWNPGLPCHGPGQQRLAGPGRTVEQHALGDLGAERLVSAGVLQEILDFVQFFDGLVGAGDVGKSGRRHVLGQ